MTNHERRIASRLVVSQNEAIAELLSELKHVVAYIESLDARRRIDAEGRDTHDRVLLNAIGVIYKHERRANK